jgi:hypothetical protein
VQDHPAHHLHVVMALAERALGRLAHGGESLGQDVVELGPAGQSMAVITGLVAQRLVAQRLEIRLQRVYALHGAAHGANFALIDGSEDLLGEVQHGAFWT